MPKSLVVCCDGTWNKADQQRPTNVVRFYDAVVQSDAQLAYYHPGVGTNPWDRIVGGLFGVGLSQAVKDCYAFLVDAFEPGDRIYLTGFSRGAYTARSLAGLIRNIGILTREHANQVDAGYDIYRSDEGPDAETADAFRTAYSWPGPQPIEFIGVWDTVGALGVPNVGIPLLNLFNRRWQFHDVQLSSRVRHAYHALALDEERKPFVPTLWRPQPAVQGQWIEQVWFTGVHSDVGGGLDPRQLADITLHWMGLRAVGAGVDFGVADPFPFGPQDFCGTLHDSLTGIYKVLGPAVRTPGVVDEGHEFLSSTAAERMHEKPAYGTTPARDYLDAGKQQLTID